MNVAPSLVRHSRRFGGATLPVPLPFPVFHTISSILLPLPVTLTPFTLRFIHPYFYHIFPSLLYAIPLKSR